MDMSQANLFVLPETWEITGTYDDTTGDIALDVPTQPILAVFSAVLAIFIFLKITKFFVDPQIKKYK